MFVLYDVIMVLIKLRSCLYVMWWCIVLCIEFGLRGLVGFELVEEGNFWKFYDFKVWKICLVMLLIY